MLPKKNRADKKAIERIFKKGRLIETPHLNFKFILTNESLAPRISFIVPKSLVKKAVNRNLLRRRGYAILKRNINSFPFKIMGVFIFKKQQNDVSILENEIKSVFNKIN